MYTKVAGLVLGLIPLTAFKATGDSSLSVDESCRYGVWSSPDTLRAADGSYLYVEMPKILRVNGELALVGSPAFSYRLDNRGSPIAASFARIAGAFLSRGATGHPVPFPPGAGETSYLPAVVDRQGAINVVWVADEGRSNPNHGDSLLHYSKFAKGHWSAPVVLDSAPPYHWSPIQPSELFSVSDSLEFVFPSHGWKTHAFAAVYVRWRDSTVRTDRFPHQLSLGYFAAAPIDGGVRLAYITGDIEGHSSNSVFSARLMRGASPVIKDSVRVAASNGGEAYDLKILSPPKGLWYLFWRYTPPGRPEGDSLQLATSADSGRTWRRQRGTFVLGSIDWPVAELGLRGELLVMFRRLADTPRLAEATWDDGKWSAVADLKFIPFSHPSAARIGLSQLLIWGAWNGPASDRVPVTLISRRALACAH